MQKTRKKKHLAAVYSQQEVIALLSNSSFSFLKSSLFTKYLLICNDGVSICFKERITDSPRVVRTSMRGSSFLLHRIWVLSVAHSLLHIRCGIVLLMTNRPVVGDCPLQLLSSNWIVCRNGLSHRQPKQTCLPTISTVVIFGSDSFGNNNRLKTSHWETVKTRHDWKEDPAMSRLANDFKRISWVVVTRVNEFSPTVILTRRGQSRTVKLPTTMVDGQKHRSPITTRTSCGMDERIRDWDSWRELLAIEMKRRRMQGEKRVVAIFWVLQQPSST